MRNDTYWTILFDKVVLGPHGEKMRGVLTLGFSIYDIFKKPKLTVFDHGFDALGAGFWIGLEKPVAADA